MIGNKYKLPEYIMNSLYSAYKPNPLRFGVTALEEPPLIRTLKREYWDKINDDVADKLWMIHGNSLDAFIKDNSREGLCNIKLEKIWTQDADGRDIIIVSKPDYYNPITGLLADLKDTSVWSVINGKDDWNFQLNSYDYFMHLLMPELVVKNLEIHAYCKDWKKNEKLRNGPNYPEIPFVMIPITRWNRDRQKEEINKRLEDHLTNPTRECTDKEKWKKEDVWAVKKKGNKKAERGGLHDSKFQAEQFIYGKKGDGKQYIIEHRPGTCGRCSGYCSVSDYCPHYSGESK